LPASVALNPKHWRKRAKEARNLADKMNDPLAKAMMLLIAKDYELLAERAEERAENLATRKRPTTRRAEGVAQRMSVRPPYTKHPRSTDAAPRGPRSAPGVDEGR
jgi:hypothetical protein